ncbi:geobacillin-26 family protein [Desulfosporosinus hippei]|uniref:Uncharacterized protein n=1 Tax=Desulfosporosinus hippei DSM 8344 TaxID=1121419 RepID=A0A1G8KHD0_9FIRM|nr:geobacillin-26 family protein [Desulfosporosinus hippei]SDI42816.1 hypothetical protein SAMN05443529_13832 [Desulfosporosinus hippei DSM 8344]
MKIIFKILSLFLTLCMMFVFTVPCFASNSKNNIDVRIIDGNTITTEVLADNDSLKTVKVTEDKEKTYVVTYDKKANELTTVETDMHTGKSKNTVAKLKLNSKANEINTAAASSSYSNFGMFFDGSYYVTNTTWLIENSDEESKYRTSDSTVLYNFKAAVDNMVRSENAAITAGGVAICGAVVGTLTAPTGIGAVIGAVTALGGSITCANKLWDAWSYQDDVDFYWDRA